MAERIAAERIESLRKKPFFLLEQEHLFAAEQSQKDIVDVDEEDIHLAIRDIGIFSLRSLSWFIVYGNYNREGRSIRVSYSNGEGAEDVLPGDYKFSIAKDQWVEFATFDKSLRVRLTMLEDLPKEAGVLAEELDPDPNLDAHVALSRKSDSGANEATIPQKDLIRN